MNPFDITDPLPTGTVLLEASAGTGKTWTIGALVTRYVAEGGARLEQMLVVTFGRAASQELRERVRAQLVEAERVLSDDPVAVVGAAPDSELVTLLREWGPEQRRLGLDELGADALAELLARGAAERHDEHLLEGGDPLGDVPGHERADRPGLPGAGAGLEQDGAGGQRVADAEGVHSGPTFSAPVSNGSQIRQAYVARPASSRALSGAPGP